MFKLLKSNSLQVSIFLLALFPSFSLSDHKQLPASSADGWRVISMINQRILEIKSQYPELSEYSLPESFKGLRIDYMYKVEYIYYNVQSGRGFYKALPGGCQIAIQFFFPTDSGWPEIQDRENVIAGMHYFQDKSFLMIHLETPNRQLLKVLDKILQESATKYDDAISPGKH